MVGRGHRIVKSISHGQPEQFGIVIRPNFLALLFLKPLIIVVPSSDFLVEINNDGK